MTPAPRRQKSLRFRSLRLAALVALAYALALQGLLGAMGAGAHAAEARLAAQLGVICAIHGVTDPATGKDDSGPGKLACVEHCLPMAGQAAAPIPAAAGTPVAWRAAVHAPTIPPASASPSPARPPPSRGPPLS